ncbi:LysR family transcriptional regulator [Thioclava dalianensis]|uniref:LysR family transcriptional regulator n=1 Tax=Thioclava dalianensis TaxID=1185766 RepID=A0A074UA96_9RHOB|nr:LysR substrate-binding domain-containing protein [Thioclava dalianensis]KEP71622.1 LysR family transcriptional regulator [Thioclava dalianensis]SFN42899.1 DNA-binding transcriptional regulator, LysR family [Thioclava dalianensis]
MQNLNRIPPSYLRAIEAIGRCGSLSEAAAELGVTSGAVSQRLAKAEAALGITLFHRAPGGLVPTDLCARVLPGLTQGMEMLSSAVTQIETADRCSLTVSVAPLFASRWLVWRLQKFYELEPAINIRVDPRVSVLDLRRSEIDVGLRVGTSPGSGVIASDMLEQKVFPVCAPELAARITSIDEMLRQPILRENDRMLGWDVWLRAQGRALPTLPPGPTYGDAGMCLDAAMAGQGVFMAWETLACDALARGQLAAPLPGRYSTGQRYWFAINPDSAGKPAVRRFQGWLMDELNRSVAQWEPRETG